MNNTKSLQNNSYTDTDTDTDTDTSSPIYNSLKTNYLFWFSIVLSIISISYFTTGYSISSYISGIYTYIFIAFW